MRFGLLDVLRGIASLGMVVFHTAFDLVFFGLVSIELYEGGWLLFQRSIAFLFILVSGVSLALAHAKYPTLRKQSRGLAILLGCALLITIVTWVFFPRYAILFGIIHFLLACRLIGFAILRSVSVPALGWFVLGLAALFLNWGIPFSQAPSGMYIGLPFGFAPPEFISLDYYPIFPWSGIFFIGVGLGTLLVKRKIRLPVLAANPLIQTMELVGRNALFVYMVHQVFIMGIILAVFFLVIR